MENKKSKKSRILEGLARDFQARTVHVAYMDDPEARSAYAGYYGEVGFAKGLDLSREILRKGGSRQFGEKVRLRLLDLGSGTGEFLMGIVTGLLGEDPPREGRRWEVQTVDRSRSVLSDLPKSWSAKFPENPPELLSRVGTLPLAPEFFGPEETFDLIMMANVLAENEILSHEFAEMFSLLSRRVREGGFILLVEPADRRGSRALLVLGDDLRSMAPDLSIVAPCPNGREGSCPALLDPADWCHEDRPAEFSGTLVRTALALGHKKDSLKMSYLILRRGVPSSFPAVPLLRLLSDLQREKGMSWGLFCNGSGLCRIRLLNRHRSDANRTFFHLRRGDEIRNPGRLAPASSRNPKDHPAGKEEMVDWPMDEPVMRFFRANGISFGDNRDA